ncbi:putative membrane protein YphA, DoxX/SURF4 family [Desulfuromonas soudanensis]|uniref:Putative membrane protein YphA, DoxX/SURF4 family n=1 Tax=Desulfuromonas soudanensis TaxID=1603606 RepID=A0A0M3QET3_9BACT|nr:DoxX family protein [Desulfuromonas soudanensis]ALC14873.1 putative membrane protein YphA, DoxX/SURF4 family [Desulfuromonas soudanensis]
MLGKLMNTGEGTAPLVLRVMLGLVFFPHGAQKVLGWFGGHGLSGTLDFFTQTMGVPLILALLVIAAEFLGALGLIVGLLTRVAAFGIGCVMLGAIALVHWQNGFFMNWGGKQGGEGFEYHLLALAISLALMITGGGRFSLDGLLKSRSGSQRS